jgi:acyl-CoA thioesterase-1
MKQFGWDRRKVMLASASAALAGSAWAASPVLLILGDSLSAEYGLKRGTGWVSLLETRLSQEKFDARVVNASISGETSAGGRARLPALLAQHRPRYVVIELGGNDALRGLPLSMTEDHLSAMAQAARQAGARVLLVGMQLPPNYGREYGERFSDLFVKVARQQQAAVVPFFLKGFADKPDAARYFQPDRIHPTEEAQPLMLAVVWPEIRKLLAPRPALPPPAL